MDGWYYTQQAKRQRTEEDHVVHSLPKVIIHTIFYLQSASAIVVIGAFVCLIKHPKLLIYFTTFINIGLFYC